MKGGYQILDVTNICKKYASSSEAKTLTENDLTDEEKEQFFNVAGNKPILCEVNDNRLYSVNFAGSTAEGRLIGASFSGNAINEYNVNLYLKETGPALLTVKVNVNMIEKTINIKLPQLKA